MKEKNINDRVGQGRRIHSHICNEQENWQQALFSFILNGHLISSS
jgi:hypothetical protein